MGLVDDHLLHVIWTRLSLIQEYDKQLKQWLTNFRIQSHDDYCDEELKGTEWTAIGLSGKITFAAYEKDDFFGKHSDLRVSIPPNLSHITLLIYLNELDLDFTGGTMNIYDVTEIIDRISPKTGRAMLFLQEKTLHEGGKVDSGVKYLLRTDIMFRQKI